MEIYSSKLEWLKERPDKAKDTPDGQELLRIFERIQARQGDKVDPLFPWLWREWKKGNLTLGSVVGNAAYIGHIADWYHSNHETRRGVDLMRFAWDEVTRKVLDWDTAREQEKATTIAGDPTQHGKTIYQFGDGWTIRQLLTPEECVYEGKVMKGCQDQYGNAVKSGDSVLLSLRDPEGVPHVTIEIEPRILPELGDNSPTSWNQGSVVQIMGVANQEPKPEYKAKVKEWVESVDPEARPLGQDRYIAGFKAFVDHIRGAYPEDELGWEGYYDYDPRDYSLGGSTDFNWPAILAGATNDLANMDWQRVNWTGQVKEYAQEIVETAAEHNRIPELAEAAQKFEQEQMEDFEDWRMMNSQFVENDHPDLMDREWADTPEDQEAYTQAMEAYEEEEANWMNEHPYGFASLIMNLLTPYYRDGGYRNGKLAGIKGDEWKQPWRYDESLEQIVLGEPGEKFEGNGTGFIDLHTGAIGGQADPDLLQEVAEKMGPGFFPEQMPDNTWNDGGEWSTGPIDQHGIDDMHPAIQS